MQSDVETRSLRLSQLFDPKTKKTNAPQYTGLKTEDETTFSAAAKFEFIDVNPVGGGSAGERWGFDQGTKILVHFLKGRAAYVHQSS